MNLDEVYMRLGLAAHLAHDRNKAADAFGHVYYEFALSERAADAGLELTRLELPPAPSGSERYKLELGRAERLFAVRQYVPARAAFDALKPRATDDDRALIQLRLAECDYRQKRPRLAKGCVVVARSTEGRGGPKRCTTTPSPRAIWATFRPSSAPPAKSPMNFRPRRGPRKR